MANDDSINAQLRKSMLFRYLDDAALKEILAMADIVHYKTDDRIISEGEVSSYLYTVLEGNVITPVELGLTDEDKDNDDDDLVTLKEVRIEAERKAVRRAMAQTGNNISQAAKLLDVSRPTLHALLKKFDFEEK